MDLPLTRDRAQKLARWMKSSFGPDLTQCLAGTPFPVDIACAIACQESGLYLVDFIGKMSDREALGRCVFDASGDADGTSRAAFPKNTPAFVDRLGQAFADQLIGEANQARQVRGLGPKQWVYKGYGLFQYDLQSVLVDPDFFQKALWYDFDECAKRLVKELMSKYKATGTVDDSIRAYNGSGPRALQYLANVKQFIEFCSEA